MSIPGFTAAEATFSGARYELVVHRSLNVPTSATLAGVGPRQVVGEGVKVVPAQLSTCASGAQCFSPILGDTCTCPPGETCRPRCTTRRTCTVRPELCLFVPFP